MSLDLSKDLKELIRLQRIILEQQLQYTKKWYPIPIKLDIHISASVAEIHTIKCIADVAGSLNDTFFYIEGIVATTLRRKQFYVWMNINAAGTDPSIAGMTGLEIAVATNATADTIATAIHTAIDAEAEFGSAAVTDTVTVTNADKGEIKTLFDSAVPTGFTFAVTTPGYNPGYALVNSNKKIFDFDYEFHSIQVVAETNALASILISINDYMYHENTFVIDAIENFKDKRTEYADGYYISATIVNEYPFKMKVKGGWVLRIYGRNSHTAIQYVKLIINGWKLKPKSQDAIRAIKEVK